LWSRIADDYKRLREDGRGPGRALNPDQERKLFETAASREEWRVAYYAALLASNTTARGCELKALRIGDVDLAEGVMRINRSKTEAGRRIVPLNPAAKWAAARAIERAQALGAASPEHFLFPACQRLTIDVTDHQKTWRTAWRSLTKAADLPGLRFHDLRHHAITRLAEAGVPDATLMALAGHVSPEMLAHYSHVRQDAKRKAVESITTYNPAAPSTQETATVH
jgi:integrase